MKLGLWIFAAGAAFALAGCGSGDSGGGTTSTTAGTDSTTSASKPSGDLPLVAFAQANSADPWRQQFDAEVKAEAAKFKNEFTFEEQAAEDDDQKMMNIIQTFQVKQPKVLLISPTTIAVQSAVDKVFDAGIPVVDMDRGLPGDKWTVYIGGDNMEMGREAGKYIAQRLNGKGTVLMIQGLTGVTATDDRRNGALETLKGFPGIKVILGDDCKFKRENAQNYMQSFLQKGQPVDVVYAHNDEMMIGAYQAYAAAPNKPKVKPIFVGMDGCQKEVIDMIKDGKLDATFRYPDPGPTGVDVAEKLLKGEKPKDRKIILPTVLVTKDNADKYLSDNPNLAR